MMIVLLYEALNLVVDIHQVHTVSLSPTSHHKLLLDKFLRRRIFPGDKLTKVVGKTCLSVGGWGVIFTLVVW